MLYNISLIIFVVICIFLIGIILLQSSKSGGMGSAMGQQAMGAAFGGEGGDKILVKITSLLAGAYMLLAIIINLILSPWDNTIESDGSFIKQRAQSVNNISDPIEISPAIIQEDTTQ